MTPVSAIPSNTATGDQSSAYSFSAPSVSANTSRQRPSVTVDLSENAKAALAVANKIKMRPTASWNLLMQAVRAILTGLAALIAIGPTANPVSNKNISNLPEIFLRIPTSSSHRKAMCLPSPWPNTQTPA